MVNKLVMVMVNKLVTTVAAAKAVAACMCLWLPELLMAGSMVYDSGDSDLHGHHHDHLAHGLPLHRVRRTQHSDDRRHLLRDDNHHHDRIDFGNG